MKRDKWSIEEIKALPRNEDDRFDRKSFVDHKAASSFLPKAISAFANSGGGHLFLGVDDDGTVSGGPSRKSDRLTTCEWLNQVIATSTEPAISDYRVHEVELGGDRSVFVVDVADSELAPHQAVSDRVYYHRTGGQSRPASHF